MAFAARSSFQHYFSARLVLFSVVLLCNVGCNFFSPCLLAESCPSSKAALLIIRVQNDFMEGGAVQVPEANSIISVINNLREEIDFQSVFVAQEWHPTGHVSFAINHEGSEPFTEIDIKVENGNRKQLLLPVHCVMNSKGAECPSNLITKSSDKKILTGKSEFDDSESVFSSVDYYIDLKDLRNIATVVIVGIDVEESAIAAAAEFRLKTIVIKDACRYSDKNAEQVNKKLEEAGVSVIDSKDISKHLRNWSKRD